MEEVPSPGIIVIVSLRLDNKEQLIFLFFSLSLTKVYLSKLIVMRRKLEVIPTRVNVHGLTKDSRSHDRTLGQGGGRVLEGS